MKIKKISLPRELIFELITFIRLNKKWEDIRISKFFDILILKFQKNYIIELKLHFRNLALNIGSIFDQVFEAFDEIALYENLPMHVNLNLTYSYDGLHASLFNFTGEGLIELTQFVRSITWPSNRKNYVFDSNPYWIALNEEKYGYLRRIFELFLTIVCGMNDLNILKEILGFLKDKLSVLKLLLKSCEEFPSKKRKTKKSVIRKKPTITKEDDQDDPEKPGPSKKMKGG